MDMTIESTYTVALRDYPELPPKERALAEVRYCKTLEKRLGTPDDVAHVLKAVRRLSDGDGEADDESQKLMRLWRVATDAARQAAFQGLGDANEAWFDVQLS